MMFDWLNILTILLGVACLLLGLHFLRVTRRTPEGEMTSLYGGSVKVSRGVAYSIVFYCWIVGAALVIAALTLQLS